MTDFMALLLATLIGAQTIYTLPKNVHWIVLSGKGVPPGAHFALLRGKDTDACDTLVRNKFPNGYLFPWHVNGVAAIYTVLSGTLIIGFDKNHATAGERTLPTGSVMQGLATEPHYGRAIGETVFDVYIPCRK